MSTEAKRWLETWNEHPIPITAEEDATLETACRWVEAFFRRAGSDIGNAMHEFSSSAVGAKFVLRNVGNLAALSGDIKERVDHEVGVAADFQTRVDALLRRIETQ